MYTNKAPKKRISLKSILIGLFLISVAVAIIDYSSENKYSSNKGTTYFTSSPEEAIELKAAGYNVVLMAPDELDQFEQEMLDIMNGDYTSDTELDTPHGLDDGSPDDAFQTYFNACQQLVASGNFSEDLTMTTEISYDVNGSATHETVITTSSMEIEGYSQSDQSSLRMSGINTMQQGNQTVAYDFTYENGVMHVHYNQPMEYTADIEASPSLFAGDTITRDMVSEARFLSDDLITLTVRGEALENANSPLLDLADGVQILRSEDAYVTAEINMQTGTIEALTLSCKITVLYQGYECTFNYLIKSILFAQ